jgi:hypothetical protein
MASDPHPAYQPPDTPTAHTTPHTHTTRGRWNPAQIRTMEKHETESDWTSHCLFSSSDAGRHASPQHPREGATVAAQACTSAPSGAGPEQSSPLPPIRGGSGTERTRPVPPAAHTNRALRIRGHPPRCTQEARTCCLPTPDRTRSRLGRRYHARHRSARSRAAGTTRQTSPPHTRTCPTVRRTRRAHCSCTCTARRRGSQGRPLSHIRRRPRRTDRGRGTEAPRVDQAGTPCARSLPQSSLPRTCICGSAHRTLHGCCSHSRTPRFPRRLSRCSEGRTGTRHRHMCLCHCSCPGTPCESSRSRPSHSRTRTRARPRRTCHAPRTPEPNRPPGARLGS